MNKKHTQGEPPFDARTFRDVLSTFATGITVVTTRDASGEPVGITANSFNSVSVDPPLVLWSVARTAMSAPAFKAAEHFAIHILGTDQIELSNRFAKSGSDKFGQTEYYTDANGVPVIEGSAGRLDCRTWQVYEGGDHWIIVGQVLNVSREHKEGLVFSDGTYASATPLRRSEDRMDQGNFEAGIQTDEMLLYTLARANRHMGNRFHSAVRDMALEVPEWRILSNLAPGVKRNLDDLSSRTFVDPGAMRDLVVFLQDQGYCSIDDSTDPWIVESTEKGHVIADRLFKIAKEQEKLALGAAGDDGLAKLTALLETVIKNTDGA